MQEMTTRALVVLWTTLIKRSSLTSLEESVWCVIVFSLCFATEWCLFTCIIVKLAPSKMICMHVFKFGYYVSHLSMVLVAY